jgi:hypothetical protein
VERIRARGIAERYPRRCVMSEHDGVPFTLNLVPNQWPLTEPLLLVHGLATFASEPSLADSEDAAFLRTLSLDRCHYGACDCTVYPFQCTLPRHWKTATGREVLAAMKPKDFRSEHIATLDTTAIPAPGYQPGTENDEIHNDFPQQYVFPHDGDIDEFAGTHGAIKRYVSDNRLWYILLHTTRYREGDFTVSDFVVLFVVGKSPHGDRCVGVVTSQACHNLCD